MFTQSSFLQKVPVALSCKNITSPYFQIEFDCRHGFSASQKLILSVLVHKVGFASILNAFPHAYIRKISQLKKLISSLPLVVKTGHLLKKLEASNQAMNWTFIQLSVVVESLFSSCSHVHVGCIKASYRFR